MYQTCIIVGNLGADAEMRYTPSGTAVSNFRVAVNERWTDREGQPQERTTWFRVALWGRQAEAINQYLVKGRQVLVEGSIDASAYTAQDGTARASLELRARNVRLLGTRGDSEWPGDSGGNRSQNEGDWENEPSAGDRRSNPRSRGSSNPPADEGDIPF